MSSNGAQPYEGSRWPSRSVGRAGVAASAVILLVASTPLLAQWVDYPTAGVPRTADGNPDLSAPTPRTTDGKPDLSGMWWSAELLPECAEEDCIPQMSLPADQVNIGRRLPDGLPYQPWTAALARERRENEARDDPHARCTPPNYPRAWSFPQYTKIVQTPALLVVLHEFNSTYRQVFLDGRPLPEDPNPHWNGYSTGHWEDDVLVIETIGFRDDLWLDFSGNPLTDAARITERLRRVNYGTLLIDVTVDDPRAYMRPWTVTLEQAIVLDTEMLEEFCLDNERSVRLLDEE